MEAFLLKALLGINVNIAEKNMNTKNTINIFVKLKNFLTVFFFGVFFIFFFHFNYLLKTYIFKFIN